MCYRSLILTTGLVAAALTGQQPMNPTSPLTGPIELLWTNGEQGQHGFGLAPGNPVLGTWPDHLLAWLRGRGVLKKGE